MNPTPEYRLVALAGKAIAIVTTVTTAKTHLPTGATMTDYPSLVAAQDAITTLGLTPYITAGDKLAAIYAGLTTEQQSTYQPFYAPVKALIDAGKHAEAAIFLRAVSVPDVLTPTLGQMIAILGY